MVPPSMVRCKSSRQAPLYRCKDVQIRFFISDGTDLLIFSMTSVRVVIVSACTDLLIILQIASHLSCFLFFVRRTLNNCPLVAVIRLLTANTALQINCEMLIPGWMSSILSRPDCCVLCVASCEHHHHHHYHHLSCLHARDLCRQRLNSL